MTAWFISNRASDKGLIRLRLDPGHVVVGKPEMVTDLVDQHVTDDVAQRLLVLRPIIQDWPAVEPDHIGEAGDIRMTLIWQAGSLEEAEQIEFRFGLHLVQHLVAWEIVDPYDHALAQFAKALRQALEDLVRHGFHLGKRGGFDGGP